MTKLLIQFSEDGSATLHSEQFNTTYHSTHGALQESNHVYLKSGLEHFITNNPTQQSVSILELGLGTHLNAIMTYNFSKLNEVYSIYYHSVEKYPVPLEILRDLQFESLFPNISEAIPTFFEASWNQKVALSSNFSLFKQEVAIQDFMAPQQFDVVYFDAFDPSVQPELWTLEQLKKIADCMNENGILVTFSAKGQVRRDLQAIGFEVERIPGPPGKREMIRATRKKK